MTTSTGTDEREVIWECKIGAVVPGQLRNGWDAPMRYAVKEAFRSLTRVEAEFTFSGSGHLTEDERAIVEKRQPRAALGAAQVPAGWKLVPVEPTEAMFTRFSQQIETGIVYVGGFLQAYRCMLDAAPEPTAGAAQVPSLSEQRIESMRQSIREDLSHPSQQGQAKQFERSYTTEPGESIRGIAMRELGNESRWGEIYDRNCDRFPGVGQHDYYPVGTVLDMPATAAKETTQ